MKAYISVNKALVTQSSAAIPIVPLYISLLYKIMKKEGSHEGCIEQMNRLFIDKLPERKRMQKVISVLMTGKWKIKSE